MKSVSNCKSKSRNYTISIAKAIGIILMVIGHVYDKESWGIHFIYMFHMPLFFILSGYFFVQPMSRENVFQYCWKRIKGLYIPFLKWTLFFIAIHNLLLQFQIGSDVYDLSMILKYILISALTFVGTEPVLVGFWFLKALFTAAVFYELLSYACIKINVSFYVIPLVVLVLILMQMFFDMHSKTLLGMTLGTLYMFFGTFLKKNLILFTKDIYLIGLCCCLLVFLISRFYTDVYTTEMLQVDKITVLPFVITGFMGGVFVLSLSVFLSDNLHFLLRNFIAYIGNNTLVILALHYPLIQIFNFYCDGSSWISNQMRLLWGGVIGVLFPIIINWIYFFIKTTIISTLKKNER